MVSPLSIRTRARLAANCWWTAGKMELLVVWSSPICRWIFRPLMTDVFPVVPQDFNQERHQWLCVLTPITLHLTTSYKIASNIVRDNVQPVGNLLLAKEVHRQMDCISLEIQQNFNSGSLKCSFWQFWTYSILSLKADSSTVMKFWWTTLAYMKLNSPTGTTGAHSKLSPKAHLPVNHGWSFQTVVPL